MSNQRGEAGISDSAVRERTGKDWSEWFAILDSWGAQEKGHKETARYLAAQWKLSPWWSQSVTVRYEQERGLRVVGQRSEGKFAVSIQRTIRSTPEQAFEAFTDPSLLARWFTPSAQAGLRVGGKYSNAYGDRGEYVVFDRLERLRFTWDNPEHSPGTVVEVTFTARPDGRVIVRLEHSKIEDQEIYQDMKIGWIWAMDSLKSFLETGKPLPPP